MSDSQCSEGVTIEKTYERARSDQPSRSSATVTEGARTKAAGFLMVAAAADDYLTQ